MPLQPLLHAPHARLQLLLHLPPLSLVLAGDSAGGNLALACAALILHPQYTQPDSRCLCAHCDQVHLLPHDALRLADASACSALVCGVLQPSPPAAAQIMDDSAAASTPSTANGDAAASSSRSRLAGVLLLYPALDPSRSSQSHVVHAASPALSAAEMAWFWQQYVPAYIPTAAATASPLYAPLNASDDVLRRLPPVWHVAHDDVACDT